MAYRILVRSTLTATAGRWACGCGAEGTGFDEAVDHATGMHGEVGPFLVSDRAMGRAAPFGLVVST